MRVTLSSSNTPAGINNLGITPTNRPFHAPVDGTRSKLIHPQGDTMWARLRAQFTGGATVSPSEPIQGGQDQPQPPTTLSDSKKHLVVLVNGLFGSRHNWAVISNLLATHLDPHSTLIHISTANEFTATYQGIDTCGHRLADEVKTIIATNPNLERISVLGHSMGGLILRYALGELYRSSDASIAGLQASHFISLATPHLGCESDHGPAQVPLISWIGGPNKKLPFGLHRLPAAVSAPFAATAFKRTGQQFFLLDRDQSKPPLLYRLSQDWPEEGKLFFSALAAFETRTVYANRSGDHLVGWANSSLRQLHALPEISIPKGCGVVREDPFEAAWAPQDRPGVERRGEKSHLDPGKAHIAGPMDILEAENPEDLIRRERVLPQTNTKTNIEAHKEEGEEQQEGTFRSSNIALNEVKLRGEPVASSGALSGGSSSGLNDSLASSASLSTSSRASSSPLDGHASSREYIDSALESLQKLPWRRVDVCFAAAALPLLAHQHLQVQRKWTNWVGMATAKHLALQFVAMEELRKQGGVKTSTSEVSSDVAAPPIA